MRGRKNISRNNRIGRAEKQNLHYRLRKHKKHWLTTSLYTLGVGTVILFGGSNDQAAADSGTASPDTTPIEETGASPGKQSSSQLVPAKPAGAYQKETGTQQAQSTSAQTQTGSSASTAASSATQPTKQPSSAAQTPQASQATSQSAQPTQASQVPQSTQPSQAAQAQSSQSPAGTNQAPAASSQASSQQAPQAPAAQVMGNGQQSPSIGQQASQGQSAQSTGGQTAAAQTQTTTSTTATHQQAQRSTAVASSAATDSTAPVKESPTVSTNQSTGDQSETTLVNQDQSQPKADEQRHQEENSAGKTVPTNRVKRSLQLADEQADTDSKSVAAQKEQKEQAADPLEGLRLNYDETTNVINLTNATKADQAAALKQAAEIFKITGKKPTIQYTSTTKLSVTTDISNPDYRSGWQQAQKSIDEINKPISSAGAVVLQVGDLGKIGQVLDAYVASHAEDENGIIDPKQVTTSHTMMDNSGRLIWSGTWKEGGVLGIGAHEVSANDKNDNFKLGYADYLSTYATEVQQYINKVKANAMDPRFGDKLVNSNDYRSDDLESNLSITGVVNLIGTLLLNTTVKDNPEIFAYQETSGLNRDVSSQTRKTVESLQKFVNIVLPFIQNGIIKQALTDIRSIGMEYVDANGNQSVAIPATLGGDNGALALNGTLKTIADIVGLRQAANSSTANSFYLALANGIKNAILRHANVGVQTALNEVMDPSTGATGMKYTGLGLKNYQVSDPAKAVNSNQSIAITEFVSAEAYAWAKKVVVPVMQMAARDKLTGDTLKQDGKAIAEALYTARTITLDDLNNLQGHRRGGVYSNYQPSNEGALKFIYSLYENEVGAVDKAIKDFLDGQPATNYQFVNEGNHDTSTNTVSNKDYNQIYDYLASSDVKEKLVSQTDALMKIYHDRKVEAGIATDSKRFFEEMKINADISKITSPTLTSQAVRSELDKIVENVVTTYYNNAARAYNQEFGTQQGVLDATAGKAMTLGYDESYSVPYQKAYEETEAKLVTEAKQQAADDFNANRKADASAYQNAKAVSAYNEAFESTQKTAIASAKEQAGKDMNQNVSMTAGLQNYSVTSVADAYRTAYEEAKATALATATATGKADYQAGKALQPDYSQNSDVKTAYEKAYNDDKNGFLSQANGQAVADMTAGKVMTEGVKAFEKDPDAAAAYRQAYQTALDKAIETAKQTAVADYRANKRQYFSKNQQVQDAYLQAYQAVKTQTIEEAKIQAGKDLVANVSRTTGVLKYGYDKDAATAYSQAYQDARGTAFQTARADAKQDYLAGQSLRDQYSVNTEVQEVYRQAFNDAKKETLGKAKQQASEDMANNVDVKQGATKYQFDADVVTAYQQAYGEAKSHALAAAKTAGQNNYKSGNKLNQHYSQNVDVQKAFEEAYTSAQAVVAKEAAEKAVKDMAAGLDPKFVAQYRDPVVAESYQKAYEAAQIEAVAQAKLAADRDYKANQRQKTYSPNKTVQAAYDGAFNQSKKTAAEAAVAQAGTDLAANVAKEIGGKAFDNDAEAKALYEKTYDDTLTAGKTKAAEDGIADYDRHQQLRNNYHANVEIQSAYQTAYEDAQKAAIKAAAAKAAADMAKGVTKSDGIKGYVDQAVTSAYDQAYEKALTDAKQAAEKAAETDYQTTATANAYSPNAAVQAAYNQAFAQQRATAIQAATDQAANDVKTGVSEATGLKSLNQDPKVTSAYTTAYRTAEKNAVEAAGKQAADDYRDGHKALVVSQNPKVQTAYDDAYQALKDQAVSAAKTQAGKDVAKGIAQAVGVQTYANDADAAAAYNQAYETAKATAIDQAKTAGIADYQNHQAHRDNYSANQEIQTAYDQAFNQTQTTAVDNAQQTAEQDARNGRPKAIDSQDPKVLAAYEKAYEAAEKQAANQAIVDADSDYQSGKEKRSDYSQNQTVQDAYDRAYAQNKAEGLAAATQAATADVLNNVDQQSGRAKFANDPDAQKHYDVLYEQTLKDGLTTATETAADDYRRGQPKKETYSSNQSIDAAYQTEYDRQKQTALAGTLAQAAGDLAAGITVEQGAAKYQNDQQAADKYRQDYLETLNKAVTAAEATAKEDYRLTGQKQNDAKHPAIVKAYDQAFEQAKAAAGEQAKKQAPQDVETGVTLTDGQQVFANDPDAQQVYVDAYNKAVDKGKVAAEKQAITDYESGQPQTTYSQNAAIQQAYETVMAEQRNNGRAQAIEQANRDVEAGIGQAEGAAKFNHDQAAKDAYTQTYQQTLTKAQTTARQQAIDDYQNLIAKNNAYSQNAEIQAAYDQEFEKMHQTTVTHLPEAIAEDIKAGMTETAGADRYRHDPVAQQQYRDGYRQAVETGKQAAVTAANSDYQNGQKQSPYSRHQAINEAYEAAYQQNQQTGQQTAVTTASGDVDQGISKAEGAAKFANDADAKAAYEKKYDEVLQAGKNQASQTGQADYDAGHPKQVTYSQNDAINQAYQTAYEEAKQKTLATTKDQAAADVAAGIAMGAGDDQYQHDTDAAEQYRQDYEAALTAAKNQATDTAKADYQAGREPQSRFSQNGDVQKAYEAAFNNQRAIGIKQSTEKAVEDVKGGADKLVEAGKIADKTTREAYEKAYDQALKDAQTTATTTGKADYDSKQTANPNYSQNQAVQTAYETAFEQAKQAALNRTNAQAVSDIEAGITKETGRQAFGNDQQATAKYDQAYDDAIAKRKVEAKATAEADYTAGKEQNQQFAKQAALQKAYEQAYQDAKAKGAAKAAQTAIADVDQGVDMAEGIKAFANDPDAQRIYEDRFTATVKAGQEQAGKDAVTDYQIGQKKTPYSRNSAINQAYETAFKNQKEAGYNQAVTTAAEDVANGRPKNIDAFKHDTDAQEAYQKAYDQEQANAEQRAIAQAKVDYQAGKLLTDYDNVNAGVKAAYQKEYRETKSANLAKASQQGEKDAKDGVDQTTGAKAFEMDADAKANYDQAYQTAVKTGAKTAEAQADADYKNHQPKNAHYSPNQAIQKAYDQAYETARDGAIKQAELDGKRDADTNSRKLDNSQSFNDDEAVRQAYNQAYNDAVKEKQEQAKQQAKDDYQAGRTSQINYSQNTEVQKVYDETYKQAKAGRISDAELQAGADVDKGIPANAGAEAYADDTDAKNKYLEAYENALITKKGEATNKGEADYNNNLQMNPTYSANSVIQADYEQAYQKAKEAFVKEAENKAVIDVTNGVDRQTGTSQYSRDQAAQDKYQAVYDQELNKAKDGAQLKAETDYNAGQSQTEFKHPAVQKAYDEKYQELKANARKSAEDAGRQAGRKGEDLATGKAKFGHDADAQKAFEDSYQKGYQEAAKQTTVKFGDAHATVTTGPDGKTEITVSNGEPISIPTDGQSVKIGNQGVAIKDRNGNVTLNDGQGTTTLVNAQNEIVKVVTTETDPQTGVITVTTKDGQGQVTETKMTTKPTEAGTTVIRNTGSKEQPVVIMVNTKDPQGNPVTRPLTPNKVETLPTGETALLDRDGNVTITDENGQSVTTNEQGTVIGTHQQAETATTTTRQLPDGHLVTIKTDQDGHTTVTVTTPDGQSNPIAGSTATSIKDQGQQPTGKTAISDGQGHVIIRDADGNATAINAQGQITQTTTVGKDGTVTVENLGNVGETTSSVVTNPNGTVTVTTPDGTETKTETRDQRGQVISQSEKSPENQEVKVVDGQVVVTHLDHTGKVTGTTTTTTESTTGKTVVTNRDAAGHVIAEMTIKADGTVTVNKPAVTTGSGTAAVGPVINQNGNNSAGTDVTETGQSITSTSTTPTTTIEQPDVVDQTQSRYYQKLAAKTVVTTKGLYRYSRSTFNKRYRVGYVRPGSVLHVIKVIIRPDGITRFQLADGTYITGLKSFNHFRSIARHYHVDVTAVIRVTAKKGVYTHSSPRFTRDNRVKRLKKGTVLKVRRIVRQGKTTRFELTNGQYVTARKTAVQLVQRYYTKPVKNIKVTNQKGINSYSKKTFTKAKRVNHYPKGRVLKVTQLVPNGLTTRFQLEDGSFITANKKLVDETD